MTKEIKALPSELIDALLASYKRSEDLTCQNDFLKQITKALVGQELQAKNRPPAQRNRLSEPKIRLALLNAA